MSNIITFNDVNFNYSKKFINEFKNYDITLEPEYSVKLINLLINSFDKYPLDHSLDKKAVKKFIEASDPKVRDICKKIIDNTIHISFEKFLIRLNSCINELLEIINPDRPLFFYSNYNTKTYITKSNYWLFQYISNYIKLKSFNKIKIVIIQSSKISELKNDDFVIFVDDCIYSGLQIKNTISDFENNYQLKLNLFILVPFITTNGLETIKDAFNSIYTLKDNCKLMFCRNIFKPTLLSNILSYKELNLLEQYYSTLQSVSNKFLIYFDHKLADKFSTITPFYLGIVPNEENKNILDFYSDNINSLTIIPIIKNCQNYIKDLDFWNPKCPYPPYKEHYFDYVNKLNKNKYNSLHSFKSSKSSKSLKSYNKNKYKSF